MPLVLSGDGAVGPLSATEVSYLDGVTSSVQTQLNGKLTTPGAWTVFTPAWTTSNNTTITATVDYARYVQIGKMVIAQVNVTCTTGGGSGYFKLSLPIAANPTQGRIIGSGYYVDSGVAFYSGTCLLISSTTIVLVGYNVADYVGAAPAITAATNDAFAYSVMYEVA